MEIIFLGTGTSTGVPVIGCHCPVCTSNNNKDRRFRSSIHIKISDVALIIDTGPDFRIQMLNNQIKTLHAALITHPHRDHLAGLDDVKPFTWINRSPFPVYGNKKTIEVIRTEFSYAFEKIRYPGIPEFDIHEVGNEPFSVGNIVITPIPVLHHYLPIFGYRIGNMAYITDTSSILDTSLDLLKGLDILVINALRKEHHIAHFSLGEALQMIERIAPQKAYLTHVSHELGKYDDIAKILPDHVKLAYDGLRITLQS